jgi:phosphoribosylformimino-5-aminoimidazole carboxamide ribotide isomerase
MTKRQPLSEDGAFQIVPAVDVLDGKVVRLHRGDYERVTVYAADPASQAQRWVAAGAELVHVVDLAGARSGDPDPDLWHRLGSAGVPFQVGGGIRSVESARAALAAGAARVVIGTAAVWDPALPAEIVAEVGPQAVVAAIDVRDGRATGAGWRDGGRQLGEVLTDLVRSGVERALVTGISRDGTMDGPDLVLMARAAAIAPDLRLLASGGVGSLADLETTRNAGYEGVIVGRALYEARFTLAEALAVAGGEPRPSA